MCLTIKVYSFEEGQEVANNPSIAEADIKCFKVLEVVTKQGEQGPEKKFISPFKNHPYTPGAMQTVNEIGLIVACYFDVWEFETTTGLYSFETYEQAVCLMGQLASSLAHWRAELVLVTMIIPKGSKYYHNPKTGEICSDTLFFPNQSN